MLKIVNHLKRIFNNFLFFDYYSIHFQKFVIIILHKLRGNRDYINQKNYHSISLLNTLGKIIKTTIATRINYMIITYELLLTTYLEG